MGGTGESGPRLSLVESATELLTRTERLAGEPVRPTRDYQLERVVGAVRMLQEGRWVASRSEHMRSCALVMATGTGKTRTALAVAGHFRRILWLAPQVDLIKQTRDAAVAMGIRLSDNGHDGLVVRTIQGTKKIPEGRFDLVVVDELHGFGTPSRKKRLLSSGCPLLGLSATPSREDGERMDDLFGDDPVGGPYMLFDAIREGHLTPFEIRRIHLHELDLGMIGVVGSDFNGHQLEQALNVPTHNEKVVERWAREAVDENGELMVTGIYCASIEHAEDVAKEVRRQHGDIVCCVHSKAKTNPDEWVVPTTTLFERGRYRVCVSVSKLTQGFDHPPMRCLVIVRPTKSATLYGQMFGRVLRPDWASPSPLARALVLDCVGASSRIGLAGIYSLTGKDVGKRGPLPLTARAPRDLPDAAPIPMMSEVFTSVERVEMMPYGFTPAEATHAEVDRAKASPWVRLEGVEVTLDRYDALTVALAAPGEDEVATPLDALQLGPKEFIVVVPRANDPERVSAVWLRYETGPSFARGGCELMAPLSPMSSVVVSADVETRAFLRAESWVANHFPGWTVTGVKKDIKKGVGRWFRDRREPSAKMVMWLSGQGVVPPQGSTQGQCNAVRRRLSSRRA